MAEGGAGVNFDRFDLGLCIVGGMALLAALGFAMGTVDVTGFGVVIAAATTFQAVISKMLKDSCDECAYKKFAEAHGYCAVVDGGK